MDELTFPGRKKRPRANGDTAYYWVATAVSSKAKDYPTKTVRLHGDEEEQAQRCNVLTSELRLWLTQHGKGPQPVYDGTVKSLIAVYRTTEESPYHEIKHSTRAMYDESLDLLEQTVGARRLEKLTGIDFRRWYGELKKPKPYTEEEIAKAAKEGINLPERPERQRRAYKAMQLLRIIVKFGVVVNIEECFRLNQALATMQFKSPTSRKEAITFAQVETFCKKAIEMDRPSMAIGQALQFELTLRQIDVIGEWEPAEEGAAGIVDRGQRWSGGALWSHLDASGVFSKETTKTGQMAVHDVTAYPFLMEILSLVPASGRIGPMVKSEVTGLPYRRREYAKTWRAIADKAGIPKEVWNRDSRAGGVTEGSDAGADIEHLRHHANHSNIQTTGRYNRRTIDKTRTVAGLRVKHRSER